MEDLRFYSMKNIATPAMLIATPITSLTVIFCLYMIEYGMIIRTGVNAMRVDAIPVSVYLTAMSDKETPMTGPNKVVRAAYFMPFLSAAAVRSSPRSF